MTTWALQRRKSRARTWKLNGYHSHHPVEKFIPLRAVEDSSPHRCQTCCHLEDADTFFFPFSLDLFKERLISFSVTGKQKTKVFLLSQSRIFPCSLKDAGKQTQGLFPSLFPLVSFSLSPPSPLIYSAAFGSPRGPQRETSLKSLSPE